MYDLADVVPDEEVPDGTNLLVAGPPLTGKRRLAMEILASGVDGGEGALVVSTKDSADRILEAFEAVAGDLEGVPLGVVDCVTKQQGGGGVIEDDRVRYASAPVDMTGIGIEVSELLEAFYVERGLERNRILLHSVSTLLMYADLQTVFRFLHVFTGRVERAGALGLYLIDATAHEEQTLNTLTQLFDGVLRVDEDEATGETSTSLHDI